MSAVPPLIPGTQVYSVLDVDTLKLNNIVGNVLYKLNTWKGAVTYATTANITLSGIQAIDGFTVASGNTVLVKDQTTGSENGIYVVPASGAWYRADNLPTGSSATGVAVFVSKGTVNGDKIFVCTNDAATVVGTTALTFSALTTTSFVPNKATDATASSLTAATSTGICGNITTVPLTAAAGAYHDLVVTNTAVASTNRVFIQMVSYTGSGVPLLMALSVGSGTFTVRIRNAVGASAALDAAMTFTYLVV